MSAIIVLTIGPVQAYISQARRTQDLWQGSRILSYLASKGVHYAMDQSDATVIYPAITREQTDNIPNRMVIRWSGDESGARNCAAGMEAEIRDAWESLSQDTLNYFMASLSTGEQAAIREIWERQQDTWLECSWVVVPAAEDGDHKAQIARANRSMGARKLLRNFPQIEEHGRKCSITGEHEALHVTGDYVAFWDARKLEQRNLALLGKHERLSAISTIKRFAHENKTANNPLEFPNRLPSTSSIAAAPFKHSVIKAIDTPTVDTTELEAVLADYIDKLLGVVNKPSDLFFTRSRKNNPEYFGLIEEMISNATLAKPVVERLRSIDGEFLFEDTLISKTIEEYSGKIPTAKQMSALQAALSRLLATAAALDIRAPQPYFVILSMDGDQMGKTLGTLSQYQHKEFSQTLADFARNNVKKIVECEHLGRLIYAGGDDVLALLPVQDALLVAEKLRIKFKNVIEAIGIKNHEGKAVTASTGLAYVHHTHNLQAAVRAANQAQSVAKNEYDRNAIAVNFLRRSGEPRLMGHKWEANDSVIVPLVNDLIHAFGNELSLNLPYDVAQIVYSMGEYVPETAVEFELERVLRRRLSIADKAARNRQAEILRDKIKAMCVKDGIGQINWQSAQSWLDLARFIAQTSEVEGI